MRFPIRSRTHSLTYFSLFWAENVFLNTFPNAFSNVFLPDFDKKSVFKYVREHTDKRIEAKAYKNPVRFPVI